MQSDFTSPYTIQPIETAYKGYRMRSRLEARWAVFFDHLGINWQYEPEGYDLGDLGWYLPDFRITGLAQHPIYFEVKPSGLGIAALRHADRLVRGLYQGLDASHVVMLAVGEPYEDKYRLTIYDPFAEQFFESPKWFGSFAECRRCPGLWFVSCNGWYKTAVGCRPDCDSEKYSLRGDRLAPAYDAARAFRGEE